MKTKCSRCGKQKSQRKCFRLGPAGLICSLCCVELRGPECGGCGHYAVAQAYRQERQVVDHRPKPDEKHFIAELNPEVEEAANQALEVAQRGAIGEARKRIFGLHREHPLNHVVHFAMGVLDLMEAKPDEAIARFDKAIEIFPYFTEAHFNQAVAYQNKLDVKNAIRAYRKVVEVGDPGDFEVQQARKIVAEMEQAIRESDGIDLDTYLEAQDEFDRAFARLKAGDYRSALAGFQSAAARNDRNAPTHGNLGLCLAKLGRKAEALTELNRALELDPEYHPARANLLAVEEMKDGEPLSAKCDVTINFNRDRLEQEERDRKGRGPSFFAWMADKWAQRSKRTGR